MAVSKMLVEESRMKVGDLVEWTYDKSVGVVIMVLETNSLFYNDLVIQWPNRRGKVSSDHPLLRKVG